MDLLAGTSNVPRIAKRSYPSLPRIRIPLSVLWLFPAVIVSTGTHKPLPVVLVSLVNYIDLPFSVEWPSFAGGIGSPTPVYAYPLMGLRT